MKLQHHTILITGGSSGIGLALAKQLIDKRNTVIICSRSAEKLAVAKRQIPDVHTFQCNIADPGDRARLMHWLAVQHPQCNILVNNAAIVHKTNFNDDDAMVLKADLEIQTNLLAPIALSKALLSSFITKEQSAIINITTGLIYAPRAVYPIYNATKAGLHAFTRVLRHQLKDLNISIVEVMMPVVDTPWHQGNVPKIAISPAKAVREMLVGIEKNKQEIRVGAVRILYILSRIAPAFAFKRSTRSDERDARCWILDAGNVSCDQGDLGSSNPKTNIDLSGIESYQRSENGIFIQSSFLKSVLRDLKLWTKL